MVYPIVKFGNPVLEREADTVTEFDTPELHKLLEDMFESMYAAKGVGLAAPQIGIGRKIAVIDVSNGENPADKLVLINPQILRIEGKQVGEEGCLSIPGFREQVRRGKRVTIRAQNSKGEAYEMTGEDLLARANSLSPNALLRPVVQDSILPTVACIMGAAEAAYLAQSEVLYSKILGRMPVVVPRTGFTILDQHSDKLMERYGLSLPDFYHGEDVLRERIAAKLVPPALNASLGEAGKAVERAIDRLRGDLSAFDPTLAQALDRSKRKIAYQLSKIEGKAGREAMRRNDRAAGDAASLNGLIFPERHLQERLYSILPFLAKHGLDLVDHIYEAIELDCPDHRMLVV